MKKVEMQVIHFRTNDVIATSAGGGLTCGQNVGGVTLTQESYQISYSASYNFASFNGHSWSGEGIISSIFDASGVAVGSIFSGHWYHLSQAQGAIQECGEISHHHAN